jgi:hypothetical protein
MTVQTPGRTDGWSVASNPFERLLDGGERPGGAIREHERESPLTTICAIGQQGQHAACALPTGESCG